MGRPRKSEDLEQAIDRLWASEVQAALEEERQPKKVRVWRTLHGNKLTNPSAQSQLVSLSYVEKRIRDSPGSGVEGLPVFNAWQPWVDPEENSEDRAFLLRLNAIRLAERGSGLLEHEAVWGRKLRVALEGLPPYSQYRLVEMYAGRESTAKFFGRDNPFTADLDGLVAYRPWLAEYRQAYGLAVASGMVTYPLFDSRLHEESGDIILGILWGSPAERRQLMEQSNLLGELWELVQTQLTPKGTLVTYNDQMIKDPTIAGTLDKILDIWANPGEPQQATPVDGETQERLKGPVCPAPNLGNLLSS